jgi:hypothetical protein
MTTCIRVAITMLRRVAGTGDLLKHYARTPLISINARIASATLKTRGKGAKVLPYCYGYVFILPSSTVTLG